MTTQIERRAADARRAAAERAAERDGNDSAAFMRQRSLVAGVPRARRVSIQTMMRGTKEPGPSGKLQFHTLGYFTAYERGYEMWDDYGVYVEMTMGGSGAATLAARPNVCFLVNHLGVAMARTKTGSLILTEDSTGGHHESWMNLERGDVQILAAAVKDGDVEEMSFAFMIPEGQGVWTDDFTTFQIRAYDLDGGDVSAVNNGANPYTDIAGSAGEFMRALDHLPRAAREEAAARLSVADVERQTEARERIVVKPPMVDRTASPHVRMLQWRRANTAERYAVLAEATGYGPRELLNVALPWYEVRAVTGSELGDDPAAEDGTVTETVGAAETDILIYDEIGGSMGVTASQFARDLAKIDTPVINVRVNSPGGSVTDAVAIASSIRHASDGGQTIRGWGDGIIASAATLILMACDVVTTMPGAQWMVHRASTTIDGNEEVAGQIQTFLQRQDRNIAETYAVKSGNAEDWLQMMVEETWFTGAEAQDAGLADRVWSSGTKKRGERAMTDPRMVRRWDNLPYRYASREAAPVTQLRRSLVASGNEPAAASDGLVVPETSGSTPVKPQGRSIARIAAEFAALGVTDLDV